MKLILNLLREDDGPTTVEYAVLLALLVGAMVTSINLVGDEVQAVHDTNVETLNTVLEDGM